jgi:peptide chain release factor
VRFPEDAPVTAEKKALLKERLARLRVDLDAVDEQATKGSGPGGQKKNKTESGVLLRYRLPPVGPRAVPSGGEADGKDGGELILVKYTRERQRSLNRFLGLRELADEVEVRVSPGTSARLREAERLRKQKDRRRRRGAQGGSAPD